LDLSLAHRHLDLLVAGLSPSRGAPLGGPALSLDDLQGIAGERIS
jgi:hypothetical protein